MESLIGSLSVTEEPPEVFYNYSRKHYFPIHLQLLHTNGEPFCSLTDVIPLSSTLLYDDFTLVPNQKILNITGNKYLDKEGASQKLYYRIEEVSRKHQHDFILQIELATSTIPRLRYTTLVTPFKSRPIKVRSKPPKIKSKLKLKSKSNPPSSQPAFQNGGVTMQLSPAVLLPPSPCSSTITDLGDTFTSSSTPVLELNSNKKLIAIPNPTKATCYVDGLSSEFSPLLPPPVQVMSSSNESPINRCIKVINTTQAGGLLLHKNHDQHHQAGVPPGSLNHSDDSFNKQKKERSVTAVVEDAIRRPSVGSLVSNQHQQHHTTSPNTSTSSSTLGGAASSNSTLGGNISLLSPSTSEGDQLERKLQELTSWARLSLDVILRMQWLIVDYTEERGDQTLFGQEGAENGGVRRPVYQCPLCKVKGSISDENSPKHLDSCQIRRIVEDYFKCFHD